MDIFFPPSLSVTLQNRVHVFDIFTNFPRECIDEKKKPKAYFMDSIDVCNLARLD